MTIRHPAFGSALNEDVSATWRSLAEYLEANGALGTNVTQSNSPDGFSRPTFQDLGKLGFFSASTSDSVGGSSLDLMASGLIAYAFGYELFGGPWLEQLIGALVLETLEALEFGTEVGACTEIVTLPLFRDDWDKPPVLSGPTSSPRISGSVSALAFGEQADWWLVPAREPLSGQLRLTRLRPVLTAARRLEVVDPLWRGVRVDLVEQAVEDLGAVSVDLMTRLLWDAAALLSMSEVGACRRLLEMTVDYAIARHQFGHPIGSFQAIKHRLADVYVSLEHVQYLCLATLDDESGQPRELTVAAAKAAADRLYQRTAETALQVHGGTGFTWDVPIHCFLKAALRLRLLPSTTGWHETFLLSRLGIA